MRAILVVCNDSDYFLRHRLHVVERLVELGYEVTVVTGGRPIAPEIADGWKAIHVPIERFAFNAARDGNLFLKSLLLAWRLRPDAVHLITLKPTVMSGLAMIAARVLTGIPKRILITIPGLGRLMSPKSMTHRGSAFSRSLVGRVIRFLSDRQGVRFTFETWHDRDHWVDAGLTRDSNSFVVSGAGVNPAEFHPPRSPRDTGPICLLFASRLIKSKGLDAFIAVARRFAGREDVCFYVAGMVEDDDPDGYAKADLEADPATTFLGEVKDMPELLRQMDIVCLPTRYGEGIPRILIEAAATGLASVASDMDGCREIVNDGDSGFLVPADDRLFDRLVQAIDCYVSDPALMRTHGAEAFRRFLGGAFDEESIVNCFIRHLTRDDDDAPTAPSPEAETRGPRRDLHPGLPAPDVASGE